MSLYDWLLFLHVTGAFFLIGGVVGAGGQLRERSAGLRGPRDHDLETRRLMLAAIRPDSWNLPLFLHVLGSTLTFGATATLALVGFSGLRSGPERAAWLRSLAFRIGGYVLVPAS